VLNTALVRVVLVRTRNPLNIGAAARAMSNFGFRQLRVVNPYDVAFREARSAVGASVVLAAAQEYHSVAEAIADCTLIVGTSGRISSEAPHVVLQLVQLVEMIGKQSGPVALLFGSEKRGLSNEDLSYCHYVLRIPTREEHLSMNLGQAVAVCLYELIRTSNPVLEPEKPQLASAQELDRVTTLLTEALYTSGYMIPGAASSTEEKVRRLLRRLHLTSADAELLLGMLRQIQRSLKQR
jgi:TrmH family RNA methyltransferase